MNHKIIQWNCPGVKANQSELLLLMMNLQPTIIWFHKIFIKVNDDINIRNYKSYNHIHNTGHRASGRVSILIRNDIL